MAETNQDVSGVKRCVGVDMSTAASKTAVVILSWTSEDHLLVEKVHAPARHDKIVEILSIDEYAVAAVDVPFGWPTEFISMLNEQRKQRQVKADPDVANSDDWRKRIVALRATDAFVTNVYGKRVGTAAFDKLGATAAAWALIESELRDKRDSKKFDRTGHQPDNKGRRIVETYPAAQLNAWIDDPSKPDFQRLFRVQKELGIKVDLGTAEAMLRRNEHARDAFICALTATMIATRRQQCHAMVAEPEDATSHTEGVIWLHDERFIKACRSKWDRVSGFPKGTTTRKPGPESDPGQASILHT